MQLLTHSLVLNEADAGIRGKHFETAFSEAGNYDAAKLACIRAMRLELGLVEKIESNDELRRHFVSIGGRVDPYLLEQMKGERT